MSDMPSDGTVKRQVLSQLELRCPPLPQTLFDAMGLMDDPDKVDMKVAVSMVERDPSVVARLLHIVNSAYYGLRNTVNSAERTIVLLGPVTVAGLIVSMNLVKLRSFFNGPSADVFMRLIRHNIATAFLTAHLMEGPPRSARKGQERAGASFTAGLLHDFGKMILIYNFPDRAATFYDQQRVRSLLTDENPLHLELHYFGYDHVEAGEYVARKLSFPSDLLDAIKMHHAPWQSKNAKGSGRLVHAVSTANMVVKTMGFSFDRPKSYEDCLADPVLEEVMAVMPHRYASAEQLLEDLVAQKEHISAYLSHITAVRGANG